MNELKKLLIKRKLLLVVALGLALKVVLCLMETPIPALQPPSAQSEYEQILANLAGPLTPEKKPFCRGGRAPGRLSGSHGCGMGSV